MTLKPAIFGLLLGMTAIGGCAAVGPDYHPPDMRPPAAFAAATQPAPAPPVDLKRWWEAFHDPVLNKLIDQGTMANLDIRLAQARLLEARALLQFNHGQLFPTVDATAGYTRTHGNANTPLATLSGNDSVFQAGFDAGWEVDVFGGIRRAIESAQDTVAAQVEARRSTTVTLLAEIARNYIALRGYQHELAIIQQNVAAQQDTLDVVSLRLKAGIDTDLSVAQAESLVASTESQVATLQTQIQQAIHQLGVLLDREPGALESELSVPTGLPAGPPSVPPGIPSDLLRRRPDVRQAERLLAAANANVGVAVADLYPKFNLTGTAGLESLSLKSFTNGGSDYFTIGPSVTWRIFDAGQIRANIHVFEARREQALIQYRQVVLQALQDVEDSLVAYDREQVRRQSLQRAVAANRRAVDLATGLHTAGVVDFLNVLTAQQSLYQSEDQLAQSDRTVSTDLIALYKALGGGWETTSPEP